jgi:hypothetical protein
MANSFTQKPWLRLVLIFVIVNGGIFASRSLLLNNNVDVEVLMLGHLLVFVVTMISYLLHTKAMNAVKTTSFMANAYAGTFIKMLVCLIAAVVYIFSAGKAVNKIALFACMALYLLYSFTEVAIIAKHKKGNNG